MSHEPELPPLPRESSPASATPFSSAALRKRSRGYASSNSSDAPFFSSDDLAEASVENYESPRRKRQQRRAWWEPEASQLAAATYHAKRNANKPKDSGVFMSSDSSSNDDGFSVEPLSITNLKRHEKKSGPFNHFIQRPSIEREALAQRVIHDCLERGKQVVDLS